MDLAFTTILRKEALASQTTIFRFNSRLSLENVKQFEKINELLMDKMYSVELPEQIIFELDSTNFKTYGKHYGSAYNYHYSSTDYHPLLMFYYNRGDMENFIKEGKNGFAFDTMSSSEFIVNSNKLQLALLAYNFNNWVRRLVLIRSMKSNRIETIRMKLIKMAAKIVKGSRYLRFKLCNSCAYKEDFWITLENINRLTITP